MSFWLGNYLFRKLSSLDIMVKDLFKVLGLDDSTTSTTSSTLSELSVSLNRYDPGVDGDDTKSKQINSKSSCTWLYSPFFVKEPTPREEIPKVTPCLNKLAAISPTQDITPPFI